MHIHHLTITTGHSRRSWRHEIDPAALRASSALLDAAIAGKRPPLPDGCVLEVTPAGRCMAATIWHDDDALLTFGVAGHSRCGAGLWRLLTQGAITTAEGARTLDPGRAPQEPWCAARLEAAAVQHPSVMHWAGDMERCIAWAWLDREERS